MDLDFHISENFKVREGCVCVCVCVCVCECVCVCSEQEATGDQTYRSTKDKDLKSNRCVFFPSPSCKRLKNQC
jgi:hypothetical protein